MCWSVLDEAAHSAFFPSLVARKGEKLKVALRRIIKKKKKKSYAEREEK